MIETDFKPVDIDSSLSHLVESVANSKRNIFPVTDRNGQLCGIIYLDDIREIMFKKELYEITPVIRLMKSAPVTVINDDKMDIVMRKFETSGAWNLPVTDSGGRYIGFVSKSKIFSAYREQLQQVSHE